MLASISKYFGILSSGIVRKVRDAFLQKKPPVYARYTQFVTVYTTAGRASPCILVFSDECCLIGKQDTE
jgi:hypothetical protein